MSCSENDSGAFIVFFLPAIFGGITLLLARRWANIQVSGASTTAISRRRRIIKDPLIKRPPSLFTARVMTHGSNAKKAESTIKKTTPSSVNAEEDQNASGMPSGSRRMQRSTRFSPVNQNVAPLTDTNRFAVSAVNGTTNTAPTSGLEVLMPKHIPFPNIPHDGDILFESMMFVLTAVAAGLQYLQLYRTVWWLPHSHNSQTMNFYLIDRDVVAFILVVLARRLIMCLCVCFVKSLLPSKMLPLVLHPIRMFVLGVIIGVLCWCLYFIMQKYPLVNLLYLCYPAFIYLLLFGARAAPLLAGGERGESSEGGRGGAAPLHCCSSNPAAVRAEVNALKGDFNERMKSALFASVVGAYYTSLVPCCFAQAFVWYDIYWCTQQVCMVWVGLFMWHAAHAFPAWYCDVLHRAALHAGAWTRVCAAGPASARSAVAGPPAPWCARLLWPRGAAVRHRDAVYVAAAPVNAAEPGDAAHARFYCLFKNPSLFMCALLCLQLALVVVQLFLLFATVQWYRVLSLSILLFSNYYTLFKLVRDYLVSWRVYKTEHMIQDRASSAGPAT